MALGTAKVLVPFPAAASSVSPTALDATDDSSSQFSQGLLVRDQLDRFYRYVKNTDTVAYAAGDLLTLDYAQAATDGAPSAYKLEVTGDTGKSGPYALALNAITNANFGWVMVCGVGTAHIDGTVAAGDDLVSSGVAKKVKKAPIATTDTTQYAIGVALQAGTNADKLIKLNGLNL